MAEERFVCTLEVETDGKTSTLTLEDRVVSFGRSRKNSVPLKDDPKVSSQHCQIVRQQGAWMLIDCGSKNKTFLNGSPVSIAALRTGDKIKVGKSTITFRSGEPAPLSPAEAEKLIPTTTGTPSEVAGRLIAEALKKPAAEAPARPSDSEDHGSHAQRRGPLHSAIRVERGVPSGISPFTIACFFIAGMLSGLTGLFVLDGREAKKPAPEVAKQNVTLPAQPEVVPETGPTEEVAAETPNVEVPVEPVKKEEPKPEPEVAVVPEVPVKEEPVEPEPPVTVGPMGGQKNPPPAASEETTDPDPVTATPPVVPEKTDAPPTGALPPAQFMGLKTDLGQLVYVMDVTGSMEDPASVTPQEITGPPGVKLGAELKRQLDKFDRREIRTKLDAAKYELAHSIAWLDASAQFTVVFYSFSPTPWQKKLVAATDKNKIEAMKRIKTQAAWGGTNIFDGLEMAFTIIEEHKKTVKLPAPAGGTAVKKAAYALFLVTDGKHNTGRFSDPEEFLREVRKLNKDDKVALHTIGVGTPGVGVDPPDPVFLSRLASENGGESVMKK